tara:strand:+ start:2495 stop:3040 length:546 start_codon:yes stop_codon:yes gene_type:complete
MEIAESTKIHKHKLPKDRSYPIQTGDLLAVLPEDIKGLPISISYDNHFDVKQTWLSLMSLRYRGDHNKYLNDRDGEDDIPRLSFSIKSIPGTRRHNTRELFKKNILPLVGRWIGEQIGADMQNDRVLEVNYRWTWDRPRYDEKMGQVIVSESAGRKRSHWKREDERELLVIKNFEIVKGDE